MDGIPGEGSVLPLSTESSFSPLKIFKRICSNLRHIRPKDKLYPLTLPKYRFPFMHLSRFFLFLQLPRLACPLWLQDFPRIY